MGCLAPLKLLVALGRVNMKVVFTNMFFIMSLLMLIMMLITEIESFAHISSISFSNHHNTCHVDVSNRRA